MRHFALASGDRYLRVSPHGDELRLRADGGGLDSRTIFERLPLPHDRIALRTLDGRFLAVRPDHHHNFGLYPEDDFTPHAVFEEILWPDGRVSLRSCELTFVSDTEEAAVTANRIEAGSAERFELVPVPLPLIPTQRSESVGEVRPRVARVPRQAEPAIAKERTRSQR